jgi:hypothetical protein
MKKRILLFTAIAGMGYVTLSSNGSSPAMGGAGHRTGAKGSPTTCGAAGCHGTGAGTTVTLTLDSAGVPTTRYKPGMAYTVIIHGTRTGSAFTKFGFEFASVSGTGAAQVQAGTPGPTFPTSVASHTASSLSIVEHTAPIVGSAGSYHVQFTWTAPATAVGNITMYTVLNSVSGEGAADGSDLSGNTSITLTPILTPSSVAQVANNTGVTAYPNPVTNILNLQAEKAGTYAVHVYDLNGRTIANEQMTINGTASINTSNWATGLYMVMLENEGNRQIISVVK